MRIVITGGAGLLGRRLAEALLARGYVAGEAGEPTDITKLVIFDQVPPKPALEADPRLEIVRGDITDPQIIQGLILPETDIIFHLAAVLSGQAEQEFDLGMRVNLQATQTILTACRQLDSPPHLIFASSTAVFGGDMPPVITDQTAPTPQSSYGTQKALGELLVNDYSRRGFIDGRVLRLPTIVVRPGKPNRATSTFASSIIRDPLQGQPAICPVSPETRLWILSPRQAVANFIQAAEIPGLAWGSSRTISLPGLSVSVQEMVDSLRDIAGAAVVDRISWQPDPFIQTIVGSWPADFAPTRAEQLGFQSDESMAAIIQAFIEDELGGEFVR